MKRILVTLTILALCLASVVRPETLAQKANNGGNNNDLDLNKGKITNTYRADQTPLSTQAQREAEKGARPAWVNAAIEQSLSFINKAPEGKALGLRNAKDELRLVSADADGLNQVHVRFQQMVNDVPVHGGQIITKVRGKRADRVYGSIYEKAAMVNTTPTLQPAQAVEAARTALGYTGEFAIQPEAKLTVLPDALVSRQLDNKKSNAKLTYVVELLVEDGTAQTARHFYFIDAHNGSVVWHYNALAHADRIGTGFTLYSGRVNFTVDRNFWGNYKLIANDRFGTTTTNMNGGTSGSGTVIDSGDSEFGNYSFNYETIGADVHMAACWSHDYYRFVHGLQGINGYGYQLYNRTNYGYNYNNAFWDGYSVAFGNGDFTNWYPLVSLDIYGHEMTHGVCEKRAGLIHDQVGQPAALHESFSDIFGTAVEMFVGRTDHYRIGEQAFTPHIAGDAFRYLSNPPADGLSIDHFSQFSTARAPHSNGGIQNKAFYLLAQGGSHNGYNITGVNRRTAEIIFFRGLVTGVTGFATFRDSRLATLDAAQDLYGRNSVQFNSTAAAWDSVGVAVGELPPPPPPDNDGDGWDIYSDCDDNDPFVNPGQSPDCSGMYFDRNCNGQYDASEWECSNQECPPGMICQPQYKTAPTSRN
jgi:Zn-dependent metalloprotease